MALNEHFETGALGQLSLNKSRQLLYKHKRLDNILAEIQHAASLGTPSSQVLGALCEEARAAIPEKSDYMSAKDIMTVDAQASESAQKFFGVAEVLENVLMHVGVKDLLNAQAVNRQFRDAVAGSIKLQRKMGLAPQSSEDFYSPFVNAKIPGVEIDFVLELDPVVLPAAEDVGDSYKTQWPNDDNPTETREKIWIRLTVRQDVGNFGARVRHEKAGRIERRRGVTLGDLLDINDVLARRHRQCPFARGPDLDSNGNVRFRTSVHSSTQLRLEDPFVVAKRAQHEEDRWRWLRENDEQGMINAYASARGDAYEDGREMPVFEMWCRDWCGKKRRS